jgi:hypothetical protein
MDESGWSASQPVKIASPNNPMQPDTRMKVLIDGPAFVSAHTIPEGAEEQPSFRGAD